MKITLPQIHQKKALSKLYQYSDITINSMFLADYTDALQRQYTTDESYLLLCDKLLTNPSVLVLSFLELCIERTKVTCRNYYYKAQSIK